MHSRLECWQELQGDSRSHLIFLYLHQSQTGIGNRSVAIELEDRVEQWKGTEEKERSAMPKEDKRTQKMFYG